MSASDFKSMKTPPPTLEQIAARVFQCHNEIRALAQGVGEQIAQTMHDVQENNAITDAALEEINLKLAFLMTQITVIVPENSGIADAHGKVRVSKKPAIQVYLETGRAKMIAEREAFKEAMRAQGVPAAESDPAAAEEVIEAGAINGVTRHDLIGDGDDDSETRH